MIRRPQGSPSEKSGKKGGEVIEAQAIMADKRGRCSLSGKPSCKDQPVRVIPVTKTNKNVTKDRRGGL
jgi:hypothetical protein